VDTGTLHEVAPFPAELGAEVLAAGPQEARLCLGWTPERTTAGGRWSGDAELVALRVCMTTLLRPLQPCITSEPLRAMQKRLALGLPLNARSVPEDWSG
jgi:hypothetical protein